MKLLALLLVAVILIMTVFAAPQVSRDVTPKPRRCVPGKSYYDGCNHCWCGPVASEHPMCTLMACYEEGSDKLKKEIDPPEDFWMKDEQVATADKMTL